MAIAMSSEALEDADNPRGTGIARLVGCTVAMTPGASTFGRALNGLDVIEAVRNRAALALADHVLSPGNRSL
jgi:hypothetical protein